MRNKIRPIVLTAATLLISYFTVGSDFFVQLTWLISAYVSHRIGCTHYIVLTIAQWIAGTSMVGYICWKLPAIKIDCPKTANSVAGHIADYCRKRFMR